MLVRIEDPLVAVYCVRGRAGRTVDRSGSTRAGRGAVGLANRALLGAGRDDAFSHGFLSLLRKEKRRRTGSRASLHKGMGTTTER